MKAFGHEPCPVCRDNSGCMEEDCGCTVVHCGEHGRIVVLPCATHKEETTK